MLETSCRQKLFWIIPVVSFMIRNTAQKLFRRKRHIMPSQAAGISRPPAILSQKLTFSKHDIYIPIDAEFYADFKNVYFHIFILSISRVTAIFLAISTPFWPISQFFIHFITSHRCKSRNIQNKGIKVYIFEISIKFCVDWYIICHVLRRSIFGLK